MTRMRRACVWHTERMDTHAQLNIRDVARKLDMPDKESTVRGWYQQFGIPSKLKNRQRLFNSDLLPVFQQIKSMKADGADKESIQANVNDALKNLGVKTKAYSSNNPAQNQAEEVAKILSEQMQDHNKTLLDTFNVVVESKFDQSLNLAKLSEELGFYKGLNQSLNQQLLEAQAQAKLLPEKTQSLQEAEIRAKRAEEKARLINTELEHADSVREKVEKELETRSSELKNERVRIAALEEELERMRAQTKESEETAVELTHELEKEKSKSWWDKLTGK